jgi:hypothetical protein
LHGSILDIIPGTFAVGLQVAIERPQRHKKMGQEYQSGPGHGQPQVDILRNTVRRAKKEQEDKTGQGDEQDDEVSARPPAAHHVRLHQSTARTGPDFDLIFQGLDGGLRGPGCGLRLRRPLPLLLPPEFVAIHRPAGATLVLLPAFHFQGGGEFGGHDAPVVSGQWPVALLFGPQNCKTCLRLAFAWDSPNAKRKPATFIILRVKLANSTGR